MANAEHWLHKDIDDYLLKQIPPRDAILQKMETYGRERSFPFIGPLVGELLQLMARGIGARRVMELGSGYGFSAMHFARVLPPDGVVVCTDNDTKNADQARRFFQEAGMPEKLEFHIGEAVSVMESLPGEFDIILMDIEKENYPEAFRKGWPRLRVGGVFIADNIIWDGRVISGDDQPSTKGIQEFTKLIYSTPNAQTTIIPLRDGVSITLKTA
ncbi:MAG: O-methyltransferase [Calditrichota bacterium]